MDELIRLIKQISLILLQEKTQQEERRKRGECFNVFEVLGVQTSEVRLHSAIIAELLNPDGNHGLGDKFLNAFIKDVIGKQAPFSIDTASAKVFAEYPIGTISDDYTEGGRIDLLIQDKHKQTIIIENKIYAGDQPCQLLRYNNFACKTENLSNDNYIILYLTLHDGGQPSEGSIGEEPFEYYCISYKTEILSWLEHCLELSTRQPLVRETIQQYIINLKSILSIMNIMNSEKYIQVLTSEDNVETTINIIKHSGDIAYKIRQDFIKQIQNTCVQLDFCCEYDDGVLNCINNSWIKVFDKSYKDIVFRIGVISHSNADGFRMDILIPETHKMDGYLGVTIWPEAENPSMNNPLGWSYLWSESGIPGSGRWWRWDDWDTLQDMANGKMLGFIANVLRQIKDQDVFKQIDDRLEVMAN